ncbi:hypothetical protein HJC23_007523 [Cyclotella cryptica]|uniref:Uncharacterized protein n=1 Tax=Cyclotella cryptica TaxID=29204 RepID=A0ABD3PVH7_9STRA|eukprot:CCRYP_011435-RA/>CCRYP_011435-RA protein AED:0.00 eAED:0.00 QI:238/-1/0/1/-1/1/1/103/213
MPPHPTPLDANTECSSESLSSDRSIHGQSLLERKNAFLYDPSKAVTFSEYSELRLYNNDKFDQEKKSYTSADIKFFRAKTALEASRIRRLISKYPLKTGRAVDHAIDLGLIQHEELIGIEHLVSKKAAANLVCERRTHIASVLRAQEIMREEYCNGMDVVILGKVSILSSSRSAERARIRAVWSLDDGKLAHVSCRARFETCSNPEILPAHAA